ncbi:MAG: hypothetical protein ABW019_16735 [Chitinophagaceae bacterium]
MPVLNTIAMIEDYEKKKRRQVASMRAFMDYGIGIMILGVGVFFFLRDQFDMALNQSYPPNAIDKIFGVVCVLYGGWRIYRGYKKNYFK